MRVSEQVVALRPGVAFPSLPPSAPFLGCPPWPGRTGAGEPPGRAAAEPRAAPSLPRPPCPAAPPSSAPASFPPLPGKCRREAGGGRGRGRWPGAAGGQGCSRCAVPGPERSGASPRCRGTPAAAALGAAGMRCRCPDPPCAAPAGLRLSSGWNRPQLRMPRLPRLLDWQPYVHLYLFLLM